MAGCGSDSGSDSEDAIATFFTRFKASVYEAKPTLDPTLFAGQPTEDQLSNPLAPPPDTAKTLMLGEKPADGTKGMMVTISGALVTDAVGTGTLTAKVTETATGFEFLKYVATIQKPKLDYRIPEGGLAALKSDGTGQAFIVISLETSGSVSRTFTNVNPGNGNKLINFGENPLPPATATGSGGGKVEFLGELILTREGGTLVARVGAGQADVSSVTFFKREGGPAQTAPTLALSKASIGAVAAKGPDYLVGVGADFPGGGNAPAAGMVDLAFTVGGAAPGEFVGLNVSGPFDPPMTDVQGPSGTFKSALVGLEGVGNGSVELGGIGVGAFISEPIPQLEVSIADEDMPAQGLIASAYLQSFAFVARGVVLMH